MRTGRYRIGGLLLVVLLVAGGCGDDDDDGDEAAPPGSSTSVAEGGGGEAGDEACTPERAGGEITMAVFSETRSLDPTVSSGSGTTGGTELAALYDTLMVYDGGTGEFVPHVAESLEGSDDLTEWTLTLRDGITFGNGDPLTTEAVKASIERHLAPDSISPSRSLLGNIAEMAVVDDLTMTFTLTGPWGAFPYVLSEESGMITNPAVVEELGESFGTNPVGAGVGPFEPSRFAAGEEIVLTAKDDYWGGDVCVEQLRFIALAGAQATYDALELGEANVAFLRDPFFIEETRSEGLEGLSTLQNGSGIILINNGVAGTTPPTTDVRLRKAIVHAIDPEVINDRAFEGTAPASSALVAEQSVLYQGLEGPEFDPDLASSLVEEVKAEGDWDGRIAFLCDPERSEIAIATEAMLEAVGFEVELNSSITIPDLVSQVLVEHNFELACFGQNMGDFAPWVALDVYASDSTTNRVGFADPRMDAALDDLKAAPTVEEKKEALVTIQEVWNETAPSIIYAAVENYVALAEEVHGVRMTVDGIVMFDDAYVE